MDWNVFAARSRPSVVRMPAASLAPADRGTIRRVSSAGTASPASRTDRAHRARSKVPNRVRRVDRAAHRARKLAPEGGPVGTSDPAAGGTLPGATRTPAGLIPGTTLDREPRPRQPSARRLRLG